MLRVGWVFEQVFGTDSTMGTEIDYYRIEYKPYADVNLYLESDFQIAKLFNNKLEFEVPKFRVDLFSSLILTSKY